MNILYLTDSRHVDEPWLDGSTRYRCYHMAEALQAAGHRADVAALSTLDNRILSRYDVVCVLRPDYERRLLRLLAHCQRLRIRCVADVDDLLFDPSQAASAPSVLNGQASEGMTRTRFARHARALALFDEVITANGRLAQERLRLCPDQPVFVVPNGLSAFWLDYHQNTIQRHERVAYLPGTRSHDRDFATILTPLQQVHRKRTGLELFLMQELRVPNGLFDPVRVLRHGCVPYLQLPSLLASSRVTLAPLEDTPFNAAKSHIKFIESAAFGTPLVASPIQDMQRHDIAGLRLARTSEQWLAAIDELLDARHDERTGRELREYVRDCCMARHSVTRLIDRWSAPLANALPPSIAAGRTADRTA